MPTIGFNTLGERDLFKASPKLWLGVSSSYTWR